METIELYRTNKKALQFMGEKIAVSSDKNTYNDGGRWTVYALYKTESGKFVCSIERVTCWQGESSESVSKVVLNESDVIAFLGQSDSAHDIYHQAGIANVEVI